MKKIRDFCNNCRQLTTQVLRDGKWHCLCCSGEKGGKRSIRGRPSGRRLLLVRSGRS
jgi:hypothetical protein